MIEFHFKKQIEFAQFFMTFYYFVLTTNNPWVNSAHTKISTLLNSPYHIRPQAQELFSIASLCETWFHTTALHR